MSDTALVIIARYPQAGQTKTRLARSIGDAYTAQLYRAFVTDLARRFSGQDDALFWAYSPAEVDYQDFISSLLPEPIPVVRCFPQEGPDLGARLLHAFQYIQAQGYQRTILIGSDLPYLTEDTIVQAKTALDHADVVLGPASDGGYYLIAMCRPYDVFSGIPMSTAVVNEMTIAAAQRQGLRVHQLATLFDIDELPDLQRLSQMLDADSTLAPATAAYLATIRKIYERNDSIDPTTLNLH
jgi:hypothetical protein